jgi:ring-1,2-phenylacetyl-CoA epoxidase subunit PaaE
MSADTHFHTLRIATRRTEAEDAVVLGFDVPPELRAAFAFDAGQHLTLRHAIGGAEQRRTYSICSAVDDPRLQIGVRRVPGGAFSTWLHGALQPGQPVDVMPPQGRFSVKADPAARRHLLLIAGGAGITPILGILRTVLAAEPRSRCTLLYGNRTAGSTMFKDALLDLKNRHLSRLAIHPVFSREPVESPLNAGRIDAAKLALVLRTLVDPVDVDAVYVCGPHAMNDEADAALRAAGIAPERIHIERFGVPDGAAAPLQQPGDAPQAQVTIVRDGLSRVVPFNAEDGNVLAAAARAGMDVPYSCKSGVCGTCRARLKSGEVRMDRNFALEPADVAAGFILTCQAHPITDEVSVSFDER